MTNSELSIENLNHAYVMNHLFNTLLSVLMFIASVINCACSFLYKYVNNGLDDFTKLRLMHVVGNVDLVVTVFLLFYNMTWAKHFHIFKFIILIPLRFLTFKRKKWHYYMLEFCYYAGLLLNLFILQEEYLGGIFNKYFITVYVFASGPLLFAIYLNRDKLFLHSLSHLTTNYIHMTPALMVWALRWHNDRSDFIAQYPPYSSIADILKCYFVDYLPNALPIYIVWAVSYYLYMFVFKWNRIYEKDNLTMYRQFMENDKLKVSKIDKKLKSPYMKGIFYIGTHALSALITSFVGVIMFNIYSLNMIVICVTFIAISWFGSFKMMKAICMYEEHRRKEKEVLQQPVREKTIKDEYSSSDDEFHDPVTNDNDNEIFSEDETIEAY